MDISYDPTKNARNIAKRNLSFDRVADFDFSTARIHIDIRKSYGEIRYIATGYLHDRLHILVFTETGSGIRVISFRKANIREVRNYEHTQETTDRAR